MGMIAQLISDVIEADYYGIRVSGKNKIFHKKWRHLDTFTVKDLSPLSSFILWKGDN